MTTPSLVISKGNRSFTLESAFQSCVLVIVLCTENRNAKIKKSAFQNIRIRVDWALKSLRLWKQLRGARIVRSLINTVFSLTE